jgi:hypothetical protein
MPASQLHFFFLPSDPGDVRRCCIVVKSQVGDIEQVAVSLSLVGHVKGELVCPTPIPNLVQSSPPNIKLHKKRSEVEEEE